IERSRSVSFILYRVANPGAVAAKRATNARRAIARPCVRARATASWNRRPSEGNRSSAISTDVRASVTNALSGLRRGPRNGVNIRGIHDVRRQFDPSGVSSPLYAGGHEPAAEVHNRVRHGVSRDRRHSVDQSRLDPLEHVEFAVGSPEPNSLASICLDRRLSRAERHFIVHAEDSVDLRLTLKDRLEDVVTLLAIESRTLIGDHDKAGIFLQFVVEAGHSLYIRARSLDSFDHDDLTLASKLLGNALTDLDAHGVVTHPNEARVGHGHVLIERDHGDAILFRLLDGGRQSRRIGGLKDDEIDALADEGFDLAGLLLNVALSVLHAHGHAEAGALTNTFVPPVLD